jgi:hypothetical protein
MTTITEEAEDPARQRGRAHHGGGARHRAAGRRGGRLRRRVSVSSTPIGRSALTGRPLGAAVPDEGLNLDSLDGAR